MQNRKASKKELEWKKQQLGWEEESVLRLKEEITELEALLDDPSVSELENEFIKAQDDFECKVKQTIFEIQGEMTSFGQQKLIAAIEKLSEEYGIPAHLSNKRAFGLNSLYVPKSAKVKWENINFELYEVIKEDRRFGGDLNQEGWYHSSSVC